MELKDIIDEATRDEILDRDGYRSLAVRLDNEGRHSESRIVSGMADDEDRHANLLMTMLQSIGVKPEEIRLGERMTEVPLGRPSPGIYGDWVYAKVGATEVRGRQEPSGIRIQQVSAGYEQTDFDTAVKIIEERIGREPSRTFPKTYGDWVDLAEDIKSADPADWTAAWVNDALQHISEEDSAAEGSKRKLMQRATELGIK